jgi:hypothetical protein
MHVLTSTARRHWVALAVAAALALAGAIAALSNASPAVACAPITNCLPQGTYSYHVLLSAAAQSATHVAGDGSATGVSDITMSAGGNSVCATTSWSGNSSPMVTGHIHGGAYGLPEDPAITIPIMGAYPNGAPNPVNGCATVPGHEIAEIAKCPAQFNVVVHSQKHPVGAIRGQLGTTCSLP